MNEPTTTLAKATLLVAEPQLYTTDMQRAIEYYTMRLGFEVRFEYGEPAFYAQVARDGVRLNLRLVHRPIFDAAAVAEEDDLLAATIVVGVSSAAPARASCRR